MEDFLGKEMPPLTKPQHRLDLPLSLVGLPTKDKSLLTKDGVNNPFKEEHDIHEIPVRIGEGSFSRVYSATLATKDPFGQEVVVPVAIKRNLISKHSEFTGSIREMDIHSRLRWHPFIVHLIDNRYGPAFTIRPPSPLTERGNEGMKDDSVHFLYEIAAMDLFCYLYECSPETKAKLPPLNLAKSLMEMLLSIEYVHISQIIHRDIKPANFLIFIKDKEIAPSSPSPLFTKEKEMVIKLCDFGMSKPYASGEPNTPRVVTYRYRPPEILLKMPYDYKIDVWSMGCVIYELLTGSPMIDLREELNAEENERMNKIREEGRKLEEELKGVKDLGRRQLIYAKMHALKSVLPPSELPDQILMQVVKQTPFPLTSKDLELVKKVYPEFLPPKIDENETMFRDAILKTNEKLYDLLGHMLAFHPSNRYTITQCLDHPYFDDWKKEIGCYRLKGSMPSQPWVSLSDSRLHPQGKKVFIEFLQHLYQFHRKLNFGWFTYRILYHTIDLGCRFLLTFTSTSSSPPSFDDGGEEGNTNQLIITFLVCLYAALKYFIPTGNHLEFNKITEILKFGEYHDMETFIEYEKYLIEDVWKREIFRITDYETRKITDADVERMLELH